MFDMLHTETTNEALARLGYKAVRVWEKGKRGIVLASDPDDAEPLFIGNSFAVNEWMRTAMPIELDKPVKGLHGYFYKLVEGQPPYNQTLWLVRYGRTEACEFESAICSKTAAYRHEAEQFIRDHASMPKPPILPRWFVLRLKDRRMRDQMVDDLRRIGAEIDPEGNPVTIWFKIHPELAAIVAKQEAVEDMIASDRNEGGPGQ